MVDAQHLTEETVDNRRLPTCCITYKSNELPRFNLEFNIFEAKKILALMIKCLNPLHILVFNYYLLFII